MLATQRPVLPSIRDGTRRRTCAQQLPNARQRGQPESKRDGEESSLGQTCSLPRGSGKPSEGSEEVGLIGTIPRDSSWEKGGGRGERF